MFVLDGKPLALDVPFTTADGIQFPANWLRLSTSEEKAALGIEEVSEPPVYDQRFWWGYSEDGSLIPKQLEDETQLDEEGNLVLDADGNPITTKGLKSQWKATTAQTANSLLAPTDWYVVRETDTGIPCPANIRTWRQQIRDFTTAKNTAIEVTTTVEEFASYITGPGTVTVNEETGEITTDSTTSYSYWPAAPAVTSSVDGCDYRAFYDALLISEAYGIIRQKAVTNPGVLAACVEFIAAIGDAKSGRPNQPAIQACVDLLCLAAQFTTNELIALGGVMSIGGLDQVYTLPVQQG